MPGDTQRFILRSKIPCPAHELFAWHERPGAFQRLAPPWETMRIRHASGGIRDGGTLTFEVRKGPLWMPWEAHHSGYDEGREFTDTQARGPFAFWQHTHRCLPDSQGRPEMCLLEDDVRYRLPMGRLGQMLGGRFITSMLTRMFAVRHERTRSDLARHSDFADRPRQRIVISGASGFLGSSLVPFLTTGGHRVELLHRPSSSDGTLGSMGLKGLAWDPTRGEIDGSAIDGADAFIHLGGRGIADSRWTPRIKDELVRSRVESTALLCRTLASLKRKPRVLLCASAIGFYGDRHDEPVSETSGQGEGFLPDLCARWEEATRPAADAGIRVVNLRIGVVLGPGGGPLARLLTPFKLGLGGRIGDGRQFIPWIGLDDAIGAIHHCLFTESLNGPVNIVAPHIARNAEVAASLGRVLKRPTVLPIPAGAVGVLLGEVGRSILLGGARVAPDRLLSSGFEFLQSDLDGALRHELGLTHQQAPESTRRAASSRVTPNNSTAPASSQADRSGASRRTASQSVS